MDSALLDCFVVVPFSVDARIKRHEVQSAASGCQGSRDCIGSMAKPAMFLTCSAKSAIAHTRRPCWTRCQPQLLCSWTYLLGHTVVRNTLRSISSDSFFQSQFLGKYFLCILSFSLPRSLNSKEICYLSYTTASLTTTSRCRWKHIALFLLSLFLLKFIFFIFRGNLKLLLI